MTLYLLRERQSHVGVSVPQGAIQASRRSSGTMKDFAHAAFSPDLVQLMTAALESAVATLPEPVHARHVHMLAESILRAAKVGERDGAALQRLALLELQLASGD